ncbi:MAG: SH3 domain-containing protein, partial [Eubacteriales bacterium]|nr:SH3 domain-containing protein [Eubacteriales bacterium]
MKKKVVLAIIAVAAAVGMSGCGKGKEAETETSAAQTQAQTQAATEPVTEKAEVPESITIETTDKSLISIKNTAKLDVASTGANVQAQTKLADITLTTKDGKTYELKNADYTDWKDAEITLEGEAPVIKYTSVDLKVPASASQTGEIKFEQPASVYALDDVNVREKADGESEVLTVLTKGASAKSTGKTATHFIIEADGVTGYAVKEYITGDAGKAGASGSSTDNGDSLASEDGASQNEEAYEDSGEQYDDEQAQYTEASAYTEAPVYTEAP